MPARAASARPANWRADALAEKRAGLGKQGEKVRQRQPRVSTTDAQARVMKMPNGGFNPAVNVQLATDTESRAILGVQVTSEGSDSAGLSEPMRQQVEQRSGGQHRAASAGRRLSAHRRHRTSPGQWRRTVHAAQDGQKSQKPRPGTGAQARRQRGSFSLEAAHEQ
jgi:hypothetical protein